MKGQLLFFSFPIVGFSTQLWTFGWEEQKDIISNFSALIFFLFSFQSYFLIFCFQQINLQRMYDRAEIDLLFIALQSNRLANS